MFLFTGNLSMQSLIMMMINTRNPCMITVRIFLNRTPVKDDPEILNTSIETATEANLASTLYQFRKSLSLK